ncbi:hypothetical protein jhhlp_002127 [Lomentospora prolificans]|uniref:Phosphatidate phosphatase APP1 catalytic domain-containing protein n=1 Tax=Lomentospora prolificans TaxID=41688 RepID=A0A2N3ND37_9PEZI|nr:hypothetical protein jhhlp_002127 [Lomentospora prolificans]
MTPTSQADLACLHLYIITLSSRPGSVCHHIRSISTIHRLATRRIHFPIRIVTLHPSVTLAPFPKFRQSHNKRELLRYLFPSALRARYQERVLLFHLNTLPKLKHSAQSRIHNFLLWRYRRRLEKKPGVLDLVRRQGARFAFTPRRATKPRGVGHTERGKMLPSSPRASAAHGGGSGGNGSGYDSDGVPRTSRRMRLAAMAGSMYRAGASAVTEIRESYAQTRTAAFDPLEHERQSIPGSFPDAHITVQGTDQMILFPTYAKRHVKNDQHRPPPPVTDVPPGGMRDDDYWDTGWERDWDENAVVDVDVRGWIYSPLKGPLTRKNRIMLGLARQLSGIPRTDAQQSTGVGDNTSAPSHEDLRVQEKIAIEAAQIEQKGQEEGKAASEGKYTEDPDTPYRPGPGSFSGPPRSSTPVGLAPPQRQTTASSTTGTELTEAELATANTNLAARIAPFLTVPFAQIPITIFFYNESCSQSRTLITDASGQFHIRAALPFVPTHVKVLANENLSTVQEVKVTESAGVSLISDIDDTIKRSNISGGAREIFRNTFIRDLPGLTVEGVKEWYNRMHSMGVGIHYCSNSPWQLFPVLATFFKISGLPPGSMHLKAYNGMLQGIFEPVAERKKPTLERILADFPERKFILVGDSGEADLEVYTELAVAHPGRILAIFIRDVTTPEQPSFFDSSVDSGLLKAEKEKLDIDRRPSPGPPGDKPTDRPQLPPRITRTQDVPIGNLIDFSDDEKPSTGKDAPPQTTKSRQSSASGSSSRAPPPRPAKPAALRSNSFESKASTPPEDPAPGPKRNSLAPPPPPPRTRKPVGMASDITSRHPLAQTQNTVWPGLSGRKQFPSETQGAAGSSNGSTPRQTPPPPPPRRTGTGSSIQSNRAGGDYDAFQVNRTPPTQASTSQAPRSLARSNGQQGNAAGNKKLELWRRRLARAQEILDDHGVQLYTWRRGYDVIEEATGIVKNALEGSKTRPAQKS